ncbi:winged helix-turn-helix domain-containing protein [Paraburkholderia sp. GAS334]|uniref:winged helix-turn-helix domain-containing protein n=1 Tax=Paraburkholderia sp. GAS334 TaxID=3035131 RepID=UPI003D21C03C
MASRIFDPFLRAPRIVYSRRQLLDDGWRAFGFEVGENSLAQVMRTLRGALAQLDPGVRHFQTVPRIGYCLVADVRLAVDADRPDHPPR